MANQKLSALTTIPAVDRAVDLLYIVDTSGGSSNKVTPNSLLGITGNPVGHSDSQTLTNKTIGNTNTITVKDTLLTLQDDADTTKQAVFQLSGITTGTTRTFTFPNATTTLVGTDATQTLTNKTLTSPTINTPTIVNPTLQTDTVSEYTSANGVTVDGLNIKDSALNTNNSVPNNAHNNTGTWGSSWAWTSWTPTWTNFTPGNGTNASVSTQIGKTIFFKLLFTLGTTSAVTGGIVFTLPVTAKTDAILGSSGVEEIGWCTFIDTGTSSVPGLVELNGTTLGQLIVLNTASTNLARNATSSTNPHVWANTDILHATGFYEAA